MRAGKTTARFLINSTVGLGGLMDIAHNAGLPFHENGFATTAGRYGVTPGPYLFIPFIGPTSFRDLLGTLGDLATDPVGWQPLRNGQVIYARTIIDETACAERAAGADAQLQAIDDMSTDPYASLRSLFEQNPRRARSQDADHRRAGLGHSRRSTICRILAPRPLRPSRSAPAAPQASPSAAIDGAIEQMLGRPLRLVSGSALESRRRAG